MVKFSLLVTTTLLALSACGWESVEIPLPDDAPAVIYERKPFSVIGFVGTEQRRRLRVGENVVELPVQPSSSDLDNVYLSGGASGYRLYFEEAHAEALVDLGGLTMSEARPDSLGEFMGVVGGRDDLRFVLATEGPPVSLD